MVTFTVQDPRVQAAIIRAATDISSNTMGGNLTAEHVAAVARQLVEHLAAASSPVASTQR